MLCERKKYLGYCPRFFSSLMNFSPIIFCFLTFFLNIFILQPLYIQFIEIQIVEKRL